jgi:hypothetical protein
MHNRKHKLRVLFLVKKNNEYGSYASKPGLFNSVSITSKVLNDFGVHSKVEVCFDGNGIDREVHRFRPHYCIIDALWVTPEKLAELSVLHPHVKFVVRLHSEVPFLSMEGNSIGWIKQYATIPNVYVAFNSETTVHDFCHLGVESLYLPNLYPFVDNIKLSFGDRFKVEFCEDVVNIGCFGAIRPLKNQLFQAVSAMEYANENKKILNFHINGSRVEQKGDGIIKNLRALFDGTRHSLVEHGWLDYPQFLGVIEKMDIGLQVSFTESFNIVSADFVQKQVPIIVSNEVSWMPDISKVSTTNTAELAEKLKFVLSAPKFFARKNSLRLNDYVEDSLKAWKQFFKQIW